MISDELHYGSIAAKQLFREMTDCDLTLNEALLTTRQKRAILLLLSEHPRIENDIKPTEETQ